MLCGVLPSMCGRYYRRGQQQEIAERTKTGLIASGLPEILDDFNAAPTTHQPVVLHTRAGAMCELLLLRRGMVSSVAKSLAEFRGFSTFNAKAERLATTATWRDRS